MNEQPLYERNIALEWYQYGLEHHDDSFMRFMMHWIAFNWLYSSEEGEQTERQKIKKYYKHNRKMFDKYDPFVYSYIKIFLQSPIFNDLNLNDSFRDYEGVKQNSVESLLMSIYQVRCNLFHGSKSLRSERDLELVSASANILEGYLRVLLKEP